MSESGILERFDTLAGYQAAMQSLVAHARKHLCFCERTLQESAFGTRACTELMVHFYPHLRVQPYASLYSILGICCNTARGCCC